LHDGVIIASNAVTFNQLDGRGIPGWGDRSDIIGNYGWIRNLSEYSGYTASASLAGAVGLKALGIDLILWGGGASHTVNTARRRYTFHFQIARTVFYFLYH